MKARTLKGGRVFDYDQGISRLVARLQHMDGDWSPTPLREKIECIAVDLERLIDVLEADGVAQSQIELEHDKEPPAGISPDGMPLPLPDSGFSYQVTIMRMRDLAGAARRAANALPSPRAKRALPFAATALLRLRYEHGFQKPAISDVSADVLELKRVCDLANLPKAPETIRNALSSALKTFDPDYFPDGVFEIVFGG